MHPSFSDIVYFIETANTLNVSRASERLGITQPSLSASIKRLENSLNTSLFVRSKTGVSLTRAGSLFLQRAKELQQTWENVASGISMESEEASGVYKIGAHSSVAQYYLPKKITELMANHPKLQIQLVHNLSRIVCEAVVSFELDFGIVVNPVPHPDLIITELLKDEVAFWISPQCKKENQDVIICDPNLLQAQDLLRKVKSKKFTLQRQVTTSNLEMAAQLTHEGCGIGIIPTKVVEAQTHVKIKRVLDMPVFNDRICLIYRGDMPKTMAAKEIIKVIKA